MLRAIASAMRYSGNWIQNIARQPNDSTIGPPTNTPMTGAPAPTNDQ